MQPGTPDKLPTPYRPITARPFFQSRAGQQPSEHLAAPISSREARVISRSSITAGILRFKSDVEGVPVADVVLPVVGDTADRFDRHQSEVRLGITAAVQGEGFDAKRRHMLSATAVARGAGSTPKRSAMYPQPGCGLPTPRDSVHTDVRRPKTMILRQTR